MISLNDEHSTSLSATRIGVVSNFTRRISGAGRRDASPVR